jgi:hypothetical protein
MAFALKIEDSDIINKNIFLGESSSWHDTSGVELIQKAYKIKLQCMESIREKHSLIFRPPERVIEGCKPLR